MFGSKKIPWECYPIRTMADDGTALTGEIVYWAKDFYVELHKPFKVQSRGSHLMYMIPSAFTVDENKEHHFRSEHGYIYVNLYHKGKEMLKELYEEKKEDNAQRSNRKTGILSKPMTWLEKIFGKDER